MAVTSQSMWELMYPIGVTVHILPLVCPNYQLHSAASRLAVFATLLNGSLQGDKAVLKHSPRLTFKAVRPTLQIPPKEYSRIVSIKIRHNMIFESF